jgi:predicted transposase YbfD/YdcC
MAAITHVGSIKKHFGKLRDPRVVGRTRHLLIDIICIAICGVIADCDDWREIALFAQQRETWFKRFLRLPNGVPSHDTFERVFAQLNPRVFERCCVGWLQCVGGLLGVDHIAIDGKTLCGSANAKHGPLHLVSAWAVQAHLSLGQVAVDGKSNEIAAIPLLLDLLELKGALVTIDAIGCQKAIAKKIIDGGGHYILALKANQTHLLEDVQLTVGAALDGNLPAGVMSQYTTVEHGHGRREERSYVVVEYTEKIRNRAAWPKLKVVGMCVNERTVDGTTTTETRYFIGSRSMSARKYGQALRNHWRIENCLHWQLDVAMSEDASHIQERNRAENFAMMRKVGLSLLKQNPRQDSMARKRKAAALDTDFLAEILMGAANAEKV